MHRIVIGFENGNEIEVVCEKYEFTSSSATGEITQYDIKGIDGDIPIFMKCKAIEYIIKKQPKQEDSECGKN